MQYSKLLIEYANPIDLTDSVILQYKLREHTVVERWANKIIIANKKYSIDAPDRFGGFGTISDQKNYAVHYINQIIDTINNFKKIIDRNLTDINDQDTLNYLHHIFEIYHGLLENQHNDFWLSAPASIRVALSNLNLAVHRCEWVARGVRPHHFVTWHQMPKFDLLRDDEYDLFDDNITNGTVYLLYVEIGKRLDDLANDNDSYIADEAFQPYRHYSADFVVHFWNSDPLQLIEDRVKIKQYYDTHSEFFTKRNLPWGHPHLTIGAIPLADLVNTTDAIEQIATRQYVKSVTLI